MHARPLPPALDHHHRPRPYAQLQDVWWGPTQGHLTLAVDDGTVRIAPTHKLDSPVWRLQSHSSGTSCLAYSRNAKWA